MSDLICSVATPLQPSAIGILRLSGPGSVAAVDGLFTPRGEGRLADRPSGRLTLGLLRDREGRLLDEVQAVHYRSGYTGEESAELFCHGSPVVLTLIMEALCASGARPAEPGEFTKRAFLNGKLDLTAAEAVIDLIDAETPAAARNAAYQLTGALAQRIQSTYDGLADVMAHFCAVLDYTDEDIDPLTQAAIRSALESGIRSLTQLLSTYQRGRILKTGVPCVLAGRPNGGKSTLLNALVGYDRAIVTDIPGTTRDTVEERCVLGGVLLRLIDTAGLRETHDPVERLGVERSRQAMEEAGLILVVLDQSARTDEEDLALVREAVSLAPTILVRNKEDLPSVPLPQALLSLAPSLSISARTGAGLDRLGELVAEMFPLGPAQEGALLTNARQAEAAGEALEALRRGLEAFEAGMTPDAVLSDVEAALEALSRLTGQSVTEEVTHRIFSRFCVGK